nr:MAG TPA: hypothetical protein [Caudoviricetes sp.]
MDTPTPHQLLLIIRCLIYTSHLRCIQEVFQ